MAESVTKPSGNTAALPAATTPAKAATPAAAGGVNGFISPVAAGTVKKDKKHAVISTPSNSYYYRGDSSQPTREHERLHESESRIADWKNVRRGIDKLSGDT